MSSRYSEVAGSFRDPSGYVYFRDGEIDWQVNQSYREEFDLLVGSGLYEELSGDRLLIRHLAISNNLPFAKTAQFLSRICRTLIIEFVPKGDSQVHKLLSSREDTFSEYQQQSFEAEFGRVFSIEHSEPIQDSQRTLYLMVLRA